MIQSRGVVFRPRAPATTTMIAPAGRTAQISVMVSAAVSRQASNSVKGMPTVLEPRSASECPVSVYPLSNVREMKIAGPIGYAIKGGVRSALSRKTVREGGSVPGRASVEISTLARGRAIVGPAGSAKTGPVSQPRVPGIASKMMTGLSVLRL